MSNPLVTCACLTRDRREWLPKAIECFLRQTYAPRELLIVNTGRDSVRDLIDEFDGRPELALPAVASIRLLELGWSTFSVGALRNAACDAAKGEVIAHWDDDDYSGPRRIEHQVRALLESGKAVAGFHSMKFTDGVKWWRYPGSVAYCLGTSLCYRRAWWSEHQLADKRVGQDEEFAHLAFQRGQLVSDGDLGLMYATVHSGNTSPRYTQCPLNYVPLPGFEWKD